MTADLPSVAGPDDVAFFAAVLGLSNVTMDQGWVRRLEADDLDAAYAAALAGGHDIVHPPTTEPWGIRLFLVRGPGGAVVDVATDEHASP